MEQDLVTRARQYAVEFHERIDQRRKYSGQPYEAHLKAVADIVAGVSDDPATLAAAWLHDVVEDTPATIEDVAHEFGTDIAELVDALTDVSRPSDGNRKERRAIDCAHLASAPPRAQTVKLADLIDNCDDICRADPRFGMVFLQEANDLVGVLKAGDPRLIERVKKLIGYWSKKLAGESTDFENSGNHQTGPHQRQILSVILNRFEARDLGRPLDKRKTWKPSQVVKGNASFIDIVNVLTRHQNCIVERDDDAPLLVTRDDFSSPLARMWLFGILTSIEMDMKWHIRRTMDAEQWANGLSDGRLRMLSQLMEVRSRRNQPCDLLDCLQLSDLLSLIIHQAGHPGALGFKSRRSVKRAFGDIETLRNYIAHSQEIGDPLWPSIARLARHFWTNSESSGSNNEIEDCQGREAI
ncbi:HD domain-containing protein [uncultured Dechloromonas sp.]|uniref:HD domain-containing protein n=1 Tax=uncultured Dechloromonas sp. TaxID=171719 RepID=UPI0025D1DE7C|nr:HD domain-containing protein [uncultured Dechloromonas sp.]